MDKTMQHLITAAKEFVGPDRDIGPMVSTSSTRAAVLRTAIRNAEEADEPPIQTVYEFMEVVRTLLLDMPTDQAPATRDRLWAALVEYEDGGL